jgi:glycosyltransferase involved in cell wall biosynthesis
MKILFSAINCSLDASNGAAISIRTLLRLLGRYGVECRSFSASVFDRPIPGSVADNLLATGALPVEEPGYPQTLWLGLDEGVEHYIVQTRGMTQTALSVGEEQTLFNRVLLTLDRYQPDVLLLYGARRYERSLLKKARERGIATVFNLVNPGYSKIEDFQHVDMVFTDTAATAALYKERLGLDCRVIGKFIERPEMPKKAQAPEYITFVNPAASKGVTLFLRIVELAAQVLPEAKFLVVESRASLADAEARTGLNVSALGNVKCIGLQRDMGPVFAASKVVLMPSVWHESGARVIVEASSLGIPLVATRRGGTPELAGDAAILIDPPEPLTTDHWLVPPLIEAIPWVEALRTLLTEPEVYAHYRKAALAQWETHNPDLRLPGIIADLEKLVASKQHKAEA